MICSESKKNWNSINLQASDGWYWKWLAKWKRKSESESKSTIQSQEENLFQELKMNENQQENISSATLEVSLYRH